MPGVVGLKYPLHETWSYRRLSMETRTMSGRASGGRLGAFRDAVGGGPDPQAAVKARKTRAVHNRLVPPHRGATPGRVTSPPRDDGGALGMYHRI